MTVPPHHRSERRRSVYPFPIAKDFNLMQCPMYLFQKHEESVPESIFRAVTHDVDEYEDQKSWKQLYRRLGVADSSNPLSVTLTSSEVDELNHHESVIVGVYTGFRG